MGMVYSYTTVVIMILFVTTKSIVLSVIYWVIYFSSLNICINENKTILVCGGNGRRGSDKKNTNKKSQKFNAFCKTCFISTQLI